LKVLVCEKTDVIGGGATAAGMGHLAVMDDSEPQFALTSFSQRLWRELSPQLPPDAEYLPCGSLWVAADEEEFQEVERKYRFYTERRIPVEILDAQQLHEAEPNLRGGLVGGLLMSADSVCYPPCAAKYLTEQPDSPAIEILLGKKVVQMSESGVKLDDGALLSAGFTVLATGCAAAELAPEIEVRPRKGHLVITDRYPGFVRHQLIELGYLKSAHSTSSDSIAFNAQPRITGQILLGSSRQFGTSKQQPGNALRDGSARADEVIDQTSLGSRADTPQIDAHILARMLQRAFEYMPALERMSGIRTWTGFRAATPDKLPLIGLCPGYKNVYLATGHEGLGISTSLATGRLLLDIVLDRDSAIAREPYSPDKRCALHA
jgi:glycine/D-amino acid oxidase-like deaminating enzyme